MWKILCKILSVPHKIVMDLNNVMLNSLVVAIIFQNQEFRAMKEPSTLAPSPPPARAQAPAPAPFMLSIEPRMANKFLAHNTISLFNTPFRPTPL